MSEQPQPADSTEAKSVAAFVEDAIGEQAFDDRVDVRTSINTREVLSIMGRSYAFIKPVKELFIAKFILQFAMLVPGLLLPWFAKIVLDNVIQQEPLGATAVRFPPHVEPFIGLLEGREPLGIMFVLFLVYMLMLITVGSRMGGTSAGLLAGQDAATQGENQLSSGNSAGGGLAGLVEYAVHVRLTQRLANVIRTRVFERLAHLPMRVLDDQRTGDNIFRVLYDVPMAPHLIYELTYAPFFMAVSGLLNLYFLTYAYGDVSPHLIWIAWGALPIAFGLTYPFAGPLRRTSQNKRAAGAATTNAMEESLSNVAAVQSLGADEQERDRFAERSSETFRRERLSIAVVIASTAVFGLVAGLAGIYVTILVTNQIIDGSMSVGDLGVLMIIYSQIVFSASYFGAYWIKLQDTIAAVRRVFFFLDFESEEDHPGTVALGKVEHGVEIEGVSFEYVRGNPVLSDIDLKLKVGELVAIVGPTGAGKSTLAYLIPGLIRPTSGRVLVDGVPLEDLDLGSWRDQVTYVFQEHLLLSESIRSNLQLVSPDATEVQILHALEEAACMDFIDALPEGIDTVIGRSGDTLSVGQQQRLSIARGLLRETVILILDEPTAALDPQTERQLVQTLQRQSKDRLVIVIAHRLSTVRQADKIVCLESGSIKGIGTHEELMADPTSPYREFVELQLA